MNRIVMANRKYTKLHFNLRTLVPPVIHMNVDYSIFTALMKSHTYAFPKALSEILTASFQMQVRPVVE